MSAKWHFYTVEDIVYLQARMESDDGGIRGDVLETIKPHMEFAGISYEALKQADAGIIEVDDNGARII